AKGVLEVVIFLRPCPGFRLPKMMSAQPQPPSSMMSQAQGYQHHHHQPTSVEEVRTLWIGDLQYWVDENYLTTCFAHTGEVISIKIIRKKSLASQRVMAERVLHAYNGTLMPGTEQNFRLNWASFGIGERRPDAGPEHSIFVGDLAPDVTDFMLQETFRTQYSSVRGAKVVTDPNTGRSKGYGFVKFADETERNRAMTEMNGVYCSTRQMRISAATPKKTTGFQQQYGATKVYPNPAYTTPAVPVLPADYDANNTTIFVGNLDPNVTEEELKQSFMQFGEIPYVKIPVGKGCGFVQFGTRASAEEAIQRMQGMMIGQQVVRISWAGAQQLNRNSERLEDVPGSFAQQVDPSQWAAYYGYGQGYDAYAYGLPRIHHYMHTVEGVQDLAAMGGTVPSVEQREELDDPLATPDVDKLNAAYLSVHGRAILGRPMWLRTSSFTQQA
ncbi:RNA-binding family protein with RRM/RBD/RNP motifs, partial [Prunus dulcis]